jgi:hypothetical protein
MSDTSHIIPTPSEANETSGASANPAVACCLSAWRHVYKAETAKGAHYINAAHTAGQAYRRAMPPLSGLENIRDFIACVAYGLIIEAITDKTGAKLLYAAQVAHTTAQGKSTPPKTAAS